VGEFHSLLPVSKKICNPVQHPRWELIIGKLSHENGVVDKIECFSKVEEHHAHCRIVAIGITIPVVEHADSFRAYAVLEFGTVPYWFWSIFARMAGLM